MTDLELNLFIFIFVDLVILGCFVALVFAWIVLPLTKNIFKLITKNSKS